MKKGYFCTLVFLLLISLASAQSTGGSGYQLDAYDIRGRVFTAAANETDGSPLLNPNWGNGVVKFRNGYWVRNAELQFNLEKNELYFRKNNQAYLFVDTVVEFSLSYVENDKTVTALYRSGYPAVDRRGKDTYYEVLADGKKLQLLNFRNRVLLTRNNYGEGTTKYYKSNEQWYWYDPAAGTLQKARKDLNAIRNLFPQFKTQIDSYISAKGSKLRTDEEVVELVEWLNTH